MRGGNCLRFPVRTAIGFAVPAAIGFVRNTCGTLLCRFQNLRQFALQVSGPALVELLQPKEQGIIMELEHELVNEGQSIERRSPATAATGDLADQARPNSVIEPQPHSLRRIS